MNNKHLLLSAGWLLVLLLAMAPCSLMADCGDADQDARHTVGDGMYILKYIWENGPAPAVLSDADANCDGRINVADAYVCCQYVFKCRDAARCGYMPCMSCPQTLSADPNAPDTVIVESKRISAGVSSFSLRVSLSNDESLTALDIPLTWDSPALRCDSVSFAGSRIAMYEFKEMQVDNDSRRLHAGMMVFLEADLPPGSGLIFTAYFSIVGERGLAAAVDTAMFPPAGDFAFTLSSTPATNIIPQFTGGQITFLPYACGDASGDGEINIGDAVSIICQVFKGCEAAADPGIGDADCSGNIDIGDAVYLINYIFKGGPEPCCQ